MFNINVSEYARIVTIDTTYWEAVENKIFYQEQPVYKYSFTWEYATGDMSSYISITFDIRSNSVFCIWNINHWILSLFYDISFPQSKYV